MTEAPSKYNPFSTIVDIIVAPKAAFECLREQPMWLIAFLLVLVVTAVCAFLSTPAFVHAAQTQFANSPQAAQMSPAQLASAQAISASISRFAWLFVLIAVPFGLLIQTLIMLIFNALGRGSATFASLWASAVNIAVPAAALGSIVQTIIVLSRGAESFASTQSIQLAIPSLAMLAPGGSPKLIALLALATPFTLWGAGLTIAAMLTVARVPRLQAWLTGIVVLLLPAVLVPFVR